MPNYYVGPEGQFGRFELPPITDREAINVARNALHTLIHEHDIGGNCVAELAHNAQRPGSDIRAAYAVLDRFHARMTTPDDNLRHVSRTAMFQTIDGNVVGLFSTSHRSITGTSVDGQLVELVHVPDRTGNGDGAFEGRVGSRMIANLRRPAYRKGAPMTQDDLYGALDAAISFADAYDEHEFSHGCSDAATCEAFG